MALITTSGLWQLKSNRFMIGPVPDDEPCDCQVCFTEVNFGETYFYDNNAEGYPKLLCVACNRKFEEELKEFCGKENLKGNA